MADPRVVLAREVEAKRDRPMPVQAAWSALRILGLVFIVAGGIDLALLWYPAQLGVPEFEFATISSFVAGLPVLTTGLVVLAVVAVGTGNRGLRLVIGVAAAVILVLLAILVVLFALTVPVALSAQITEPAIRIGVRKSIVKTTVQFMAYGLGYLALTWKLLRGWRRTN